MGSEMCIRDRDLIEQALDDSGGVVARAAKRLHIRRTTLGEKIRKFNLQKKQNDEAVATEQIEKNGEEDSGADTTEVSNNRAASA